MATAPTVLYPLTLPALLHHVLVTQSGTAPTTLIVCSSREAFLQAMLSAVPPRDGQRSERLFRLATPTLHNLFTARHVKVAFCASVQTLLAYLTARRGEAAVSGREARERIVLLNPLSLHAATPSFSAQGLSRTFAAVVDMALRVHAVLVVAECQGVWVQPTTNESDIEEAMGEGGGESCADAEDPWEQEVSILNVSAKKFGSAGGDRAWAGRTVKVKRIAGRWFQFRRLDDLGT